MGVVVAGRLSDCLIRLSIHKATLVATRFSIYFGNSAISSITRLCGTMLLGSGEGTNIESLIIN